MLLLVCKLQSTLVISNLKGPSETLRDIRTSTYQIFRIEENTIAQPNLKMVALIYFIVSEINILLKFRKAICYTFKMNCKSFEKMHGFPINMQ